MVKIKPFKALRPPKEIVKEVQARPYDVLNSVEAKKEAGEKSLLHITKPEIDFEPMIDELTEEVYAKAVDNFGLWKENNWLIEEEKEKYYIYSQKMNEMTQYGLVACAYADDYINGRIKKHELTRKDKEDDRTQHALRQNANIEPVFFTYPDVGEMNKLVEHITSSNPPIYDFVADEDCIEHKFWVINDDEVNRRITKIFANIPNLYIADGHHRTAAAARVKYEKEKMNPNHTGNEEYNYFLTVIVPESQIRIIDYNRVVKDLNGLTKEQLLRKLNESFIVEKKGEEIYRPMALRNFSMYLDKVWYSLTAKQGTYNDQDIIKGFDASIISNLIFDEIFDITDLRTSKRIDFVGGIRGLGELKERVDSGEMAVAFALYPVTMKDIIKIADTGNIMPPKTTWFEPKLRSGLAIHTFFDN